MARKLVVEIIGDASKLQKSYGQAEKSTAKFGKEVERAGRGAVVASVGFRGLGRSVAFASSSFLGGAGLVFAITSTIKAAEESQRVLGQTRNAVERSGQSWQQYGEHIKAASLATSKLSGFDDERLLQTFSNLVRRTGNVNRALALNALAANVARGRNIELEQASQLVLKASIGQIGALRRLGIDIGKHATALQALDLLQRKYGGSAEAYGRTAAGAQDRFRVAVENLQEAVGAQLLPSISKYLNKGADWLNQTKNQQKITSDVHEAIKVLSAAIEVAVGVVKTAASAFEALSGAVGGTKNAVKLLFGAFVVFKTAKFAATLADIAGSVKLIGTRAETSTGKVSGLRGALVALNKIGPIVIAYEIVRKTTGSGADLSQGTTADTIISARLKGILYQAVKGSPLGDLVQRMRRGETLTAAQRVDILRAAGVTDQETLIAAGAAGPSFTDAAISRRRRMAAQQAAADSGDKRRDAPKTATAEQRNTWFDAAVTRMLGGVQDIPTLKGQIARLRQIAAIVQDRIKVTKDITRRLNLGDQLKDIYRDIRADQAEIAANAKKAADAAKAAAKKRAEADKAIAKANVKAASARVAAINDAARAQIKAIAARGTALRKAQQAQRAAAGRREQSKVFGILGLTATGEERAPSRGNLLADIRKAQDAIAGTPLDTKAMQSRLAQLRQVLNTEFSKLTRDTKIRVGEWLDALAGKDKGGPLTARHAVTPISEIIAGTGLRGAALRQLELNIAGAHLATTTGRATPIHVHTTVNLDGREVARNTTEHQERDARRRVVQTRGREHRR